MSKAQVVLQLSVGQFSHPGRKRSNNEDWLGAFQPDDAQRLERKGCLFLVADGMGGHKSGELASRRAVDRVIRYYVDNPSKDVAACLRIAVEKANAKLYDEGQRRDPGGSRRGWGTTLVGAVVRQDKLWIANVGDSRAYLLREGELSQLSKDHVLFPEEDNAEIGNWLGKHVINRALGRKSSVEVDVFAPLRLLVGDRVLLCTDGLTTPVSDEQIRSIAGRYPAQKAAEALIQAANQVGGPDNVSVILVEVTSKTASVRHTIVEMWETLTSPDFWQRTSMHIQQALPEGNQGLRSPLVVALIVLIILVLLGLGFILGLILF
jgi:protein phosphatase